MKTKTENRKFTLEKFEVARLKNLKLVIGGNDPIPATKDDGSVTDVLKNQSSKYC